MIQTCTVLEITSTTNIIWGVPLYYIWNRYIIPMYCVMHLTRVMEAASGFVHFSDLICKIILSPTTVLCCIWFVQDPLWSVFASISSF